MTPIEQVREALEAAKHAMTNQRYLLPRLGTEDAHAKVTSAIAILKDMDGQEPVAWMAVIRYPDGDDSLVYGSTREGAVQMGYERTRVTGTVVRVAPLYAHPSPSAPVDIAEIIAAGDKMRDSINDHINAIPNGHPPLRREQVMIDKAKAWTTATAKHRTT